MSDAKPAAEEGETAPLAPRSSPRRLVGWTLIGLAALLGLWWASDVLFGANLHTVIPGRVYRGAQPDDASLEQMVRDHGIRTVVNLRGYCNPLPWYLEEARAAQRLGISQEDVSFSAIHLPATGELRALIEVLDRAEYPILLHCRHGSDRTGMAAAIVLLLQEGVSYAEARRQLGLYYGHVAFGKTVFLDRFFDLYEDWLSESGKAHTPANFRHWLLDEYRGGWCAGGVEQVEFVSTPKPLRPIECRVRLHNRGRSIWHLKPTITAGMHVFFRVWDDEGNVLHEDRAGLVDAAIGPGECRDVTVVLPPMWPGRYWLALDVVEEFHCWFCQAGVDLWEEEFVIGE
jgi:protein tyrosine phosphatase (PTP) superfamily phosphohydrolase (DUF442 family)